MRKSIIILIFIAVGSSAGAQSFRFNISSGVSFYGMKEMKDLNQYVLRSNGIPNDRITENFPAFWFYSAEFGRTFRNGSTLSFLAGFTSTGSRISSADYSGSYSYDNTSKAWNLGVQYDYKLSDDAQMLQWHLLLASGFILSSTKLSENINVGRTIGSDEVELTSRSFFIEPGIRAMYNVAKGFDAGISIQYLYDIGSKYKLRNAELDLGPDWSSLRAGLQLSYTFL